MARKKEILLNGVFLKNRITELGLKQYWVTEQIGVDRKTVIRWLQGKIKNVQAENIEALARVLSCSAADLSLESAADLYASEEDQKVAAKLLTTSHLVERLGPIGEWDVIESLIKSVLVPNLPLNVLGDLYNQLTVASWRQSKIDQAELYNGKAREIAMKTGDKAVLAAALLSQANIHSWRGRTRQSIEAYESCLKLEKFVDPKLLGSTYSNLGAVCYEAGDLERGEELQLVAIRIFKDSGRPMNLSIAHCHLAFIYLSQDRLDEALDCAMLSIDYASKDQFHRGLAEGQLLLGEVSARRGLADEAMARMEEGLERFRQLEIEEGLNYEIAGRICRLLGQLEKSKAFLEHGIAISNEFPIYQAALYLELARTLKQLGLEASGPARQAASLFAACQAEIRAQEAKELC